MPSIALPAGAAKLAARQHGIVSGRQLQSAGLTRSQIRCRTDRGLIAAAFGDTFRVLGAPNSIEARYISAVLAVPGSVLATTSAARLLGFPGAKPTPPEVITHSSRGHRVAGVVIHRSSDLLDRHRTTINAIAVTTIPRTVIDLAATLGVNALDDLVGSLVSARRVTMKALFDDFDRVARRGRTGTAALRSVLIPRLQGLIVPESELERTGLRFLADHGFSTPVLQFRPPGAGRAIARVDMAFLDEQVVIEFDGRRWHDTDAAFENDRLRDQLAIAHGWVVMRITWRQLQDDRAGVAARLRSTLAARTAGR